MNELENRVWRGLRDLADTVPHTPDARAHLAGRLAGRRARLPVALLAAAAAIVVVAAVAVPVVLVQREAHPPVATSSPPPPPPDWVELGTYVENGITKHAGLVIDPDGKGFCVDSSPGTPFACYGVPVWGSDTPVGSRFVESVGVLGWPEWGPPGPLDNLLLFVTAPEVARLKVADAHTPPRVSVREVARTAEAAYFLADFDGPAADWRYEAKDAKGKVVEYASE